MSQEMLPFVGSTMIYFLWLLFSIQTKVTSTYCSIDENHKHAVKAT
jgi:hypothetical protein